MDTSRPALVAIAVMLAAALIPGCGKDDNPVALRPPAAFTADAFTLAIWHMDEGSGQQVADASGSSRSLDLGTGDTVEVADPTWSSPGFNGTGAALTFDASQKDCARAGGGFSFPGDQFSVEFLVRTSDLSTNPTVFGADQVTINITLTSSGEILCDVGDGVNWTRATAQASLADGAWHYVACTYDHQAIRVYVDGVLKAMEPKVLRFPYLPYVDVGGRFVDAFLAGSMDEVRISSVARTAGEIAAFQRSR